MCRIPHGHTLQPAATSEMSGWLYKQGAEGISVRKRFFVLDGERLKYYTSDSKAGSDEMNSPLDEEDEPPTSDDDPRPGAS